MKTKRKNSGAASSAEYTVGHHGLDPDHPTPLQAAAILRLLHNAALLRSEEENTEK